MSVTVGRLWAICGHDGWHLSVALILAHLSTRISAILAECD
jgi:hypothetical protein